MNSNSKTYSPDTESLPDEASAIREYPQNGEKQNWKYHCLNYGTFKQVNNGKHNSFFYCTCGSSIVDNKTSVCYHLQNVCKGIAKHERDAFVSALDEYHRVNPIPKKKKTEWRSLAEEQGEFKRMANKKVFACNCQTTVSYKKLDVVTHLVKCELLDDDIKGLFQAFIRGSQSNLRSAKSKTPQHNRNTLKQAAKIIYPVSDRKRILCKLEQNIEDLTVGLEAEQMRLDRLEEISTQIESIIPK